jgi:hypothetical protein
MSGLLVITGYQGVLGNPEAPDYALAGRNAEVLPVRMSTICIKYELFPTRPQARTPDPMQSGSAAPDSSRDTDAPRAAAPGGMAWTICELPGGSSLSKAVIVSADVDLWNTRLPISISYRIARRRRYRCDGRLSCRAPARKTCIRQCPSPSRNRFGGSWSARGCLAPVGTASVSRGRSPES